MVNVRFQHSVIILANLLIVLMLSISFSKNLSSQTDKPREVLGNSVQAYVAPNYTDNLIQNTASEVNLLRKASGLSELSSSSELDIIAKNRAKSMEEYKYYSHTSPDGKTFESLLIANNTQYSVACENLNTNELAASKIYIETWMSSTTGHKECMLGQNYTKAGYALANVNFDNSQITQKIIVAIYSD